MPRSRSITAAERARREAAGETIPGRALKQPPKDAADRIREYAADGWSMVGIAAKLGTTDEVLRRWLREHSELQEALAFGRAEEEHACRNVLFRIATEGKASDRDAALAALAILNSRHGWRSEDKHEQSSRVNVTFNIPAALPADKYIEVVNADGTEVQRVPAKVARGN